jgi:hypothetical protein
VLKVTGAAAATAAPGIPASRDEVVRRETAKATPLQLAEGGWSGMGAQREGFTRGGCHLGIGWLAQCRLAGTSIDGSWRGKLTQAWAGRRKGNGFSGRSGLRREARRGSNRRQGRITGRVDRPGQRASRTGKETREEKVEAERRPAVSNPKGERGGILRKGDRERHLLGRAVNKSLRWGCHRIGSLRPKQRQATCPLRSTVQYRGWRHGRHMA